MTPLTMASDNTVEAHSNKDTAQGPGLEVVEEVEHHQRDSNEANFKIIDYSNQIIYSQYKVESRADKVDKIEPGLDKSDSFGLLMMKSLALDFEFHQPYQRFYGHLFPIYILTEINDQFIICLSCYILYSIIYT